MACDDSHHIWLKPFADFMPCGCGEKLLAEGAAATLTKMGSNWYKARKPDYGIFDTADWMKRE